MGGSSVSKGLEPPTFIMHVVCSKMTSGSLWGDTATVRPTTAVSR